MIPVVVVASGWFIISLGVLVPYVHGGIVQLTSWRCIQGSLYHIPVGVVVGDNFVSLSAHLRGLGSRGLQRRIHVMRMKRALGGLG